MPAYRIEKDSLGQIEVPREAPYGAQTARALRNFPISGRTAPSALIRAYLQIKGAAAGVNAALGNLDEARASLIEKAVGELLKTSEQKWPDLFPVDVYQAGAGTSENMNVNEVVANFANRAAGAPFGAYSPVHPNDHVNRAQSTNDTFPTAMRLAILESSRALVSETRALGEALANKAASWMEIPKSARTHLQDAVPMRLGQEFRAYSLACKRCASWIEEAQRPLRELGIGGSAAGTGLNVPAGYPEAMVRELSRRTGEELSQAQDPFEAMQSQASVARYSSSLKVLALELTRICNDLRLLASGPMTGLAEIILPAVQPGSSIMPGKVNPSIPEMTNQVCFAVIGHDQTVSLALQAGQLELNVMMPVMAHAALEATSLLAAAIPILRTRCIEGLRPNPDRLRRYFESTPQIATALSPLLGYDTTAKLVKEALESGKSVIELVREKSLLTEEQIRQATDPGKTLSAA